MSSKTGERVGDYEIVNVLGAGGMGKVYKVRNVISDRVEAMKVLLPNLESDPDLADRFIREIKVQASLRHPNIAALHTAHRVNNQLIMLLEYVDGNTLDTKLRTGPIPVARAVDYVRQVLLALGYAHAQGVIHRDIKPANMMLMPDGTVKLMDFGIAKLAADRGLTQTGRTVGSLYYMSPEQIQGADLDARSDLYAVGISLYEMITARRPYQGDSDYSIMAAHLSARPVPPIEVDSSLPALLNETILLAIAKDPARRYQTADEFRTALERVAATLDSSHETASNLDNAAATREFSADRTATSPTLSATRPVAASATITAARPAATQTAATPPATVQARRGSRGLFMAAGSVLTLLVLVVAALWLPKHFRSGAAAPAAKVAEVPVAPINPETLITPSSRESAPKRSEAMSGGRWPSVRQQPGPLAHNIAPPQPSSVSSEQTLAVPTPVPEQQTPQTPPPSNTAVAEQDLTSARENMILLATRASTAKASLRSMRQQQAAMGLNLRADVATAEQRIDFYLGDADSALRAHDADRLKRSLTSAERALESVEKFLGR